MQMSDPLGWYVGDADGLGQDTTTTDTSASAGTTTYFGPTDTTTGVTYDYSQSPALTPAAPAAAPAASTSSSGGWLSSVLSTVQSTIQSVAQTTQAVAPAVLSVVEQGKLASLNAQRAAQGLPPLTAAQYSAQYMPQVGVQAGVAPATQTMLYILGGGLALVLLVGMLGKKR